MLLFLLLSLTIIAAVVFGMQYERPNFKVIIGNGVVTRHSGTIAPTLLADFSPTIIDIKRAKILGYQSAQGIRLVFKGDVNAATQQRLRNIAGLQQR